MHLDEFLPEYHAVERHSTEVRAPAACVYEAMLALDLRGSPAARLLLALRGGLPTTFDGFIRAGFIPLAEAPPREFVLGVIGRFWSLSGGLQRVQNAAGFRDFRLPGYARAAWNFSIEPLEDGRVRLATETRIHCSDARSLRRFRMYWLIVRPFSGLLRREALRLIKRAAEQEF